MYPVEMYVQVRRACMVEGMSVREASRVFGLHRDTVRKMLAYSVPPGYRREGPPRRPKLEAFTGVIDAILEGDSRVSRWLCGQLSLLLLDPDSHHWHPYRLQAPKSLTSSNPTLKHRQLTGLDTGREMFAENSPCFLV